MIKGAITQRQANRKCREREQDDMQQKKKKKKKKKLSEGELGTTHGMHPRLSLNT